MEKPPRWKNHPDKKKKHPNGKTNLIKKLNEKQRMETHTLIESSIIN